MPFPFLAAATALSAGAGLFGSVMGSQSSAKAQRETNESNERMAREQMEFQERMSSTAFQRGVEDARKAGFNPLVAFPGGGASSPAGASIASQNPAPHRGELYAGLASVAADIMLKRELAKTEQTKRELLGAQTVTERGQLRIPGLGNVPLSTAISTAASGVNAVKAAPGKAYEAGRKSYYEKYFNPKNQGRR